MDASTADTKTVKVQRIALQNILSLDQALCLQISLSLPKKLVHLVYDCNPTPT